MDFTNPMLQIGLLIVLIVINLLAFLSIGHDKQKARTGQSDSRLSEGLLFFMAVAFGSVGVYVGMRVFRHKTRKWYFEVGIPLLIIQNVATLYTFF